MTYIHKVKRKERDFTPMPNKEVQNPNLSYKATGMYCYILSLPDDWQINVTDLSKRKKEKRDAVNSAIKELVGAGYLYKEKVRGVKGHFEGWRYLFYESPELNPYYKPSAESPDTSKGSPKTDFPISDNPNRDNLQQQIIQETNLNNSVNNNTTQNEQESVNSHRVDDSNKTSSFSNDEMDIHASKKDSLSTDVDATHPAAMQPAKSKKPFNDEEEATLLTKDKTTYEQFIELLYESCEKLGKDKPYLYKLTPNEKKLLQHELDCIQPFEQRSGKITLKKKLFESFKAENAEHSQGIEEVPLAAGAALLISLPITMGLYLLLSDSRERKKWNFSVGQKAHSILKVIITYIKVFHKLPTKDEFRLLVVESMKEEPGVLCRALRNYGKNHQDMEINGKIKVYIDEVKTVLDMNHQRFTEANEGYMPKQTQKKTEQKNEKRRDNMSSFSKYKI